MHRRLLLLQYEAQAWGKDEELTDGLRPAGPGASSAPATGPSCETALGPADYRVALPCSGDDAQMIEGPEAARVPAPSPGKDH